MKRLSVLLIVGLILSTVTSVFAQDWQWRVMFVVRAADATTANRNTIAQTYVDHGGMETLNNELRMFTSPVKLSTTGNLPAQAYAFNTPAKTAMRSDFKGLLDTLTNARYVVVANKPTNGFRDGEFVLTNVPGLTPSGQIITWDNVLTYLFNEFGLRVIQPETGP